MPELAGRGHNWRRGPAFEAGEPVVGFGPPKPNEKVGCRN